MEIVSETLLPLNLFRRADHLTVVITGMMSWLVLEAFLGILAASVPSLTFLFKNISLESVMRSIRSVVSLHSLRSQRSQLEVWEGSQTSPQLLDNLGRGTDMVVLDDDDRSTRDEMSKKGSYQTREVRENMA